MTPREITRLLLTLTDAALPDTILSVPPEIARHLATLPDCTLHISASELAAVCMLTLHTIGEIPTDYTLAA